MYNNPNLYLVTINVYPNSGQIPSIRSKDIEWKRNSDKNHGPSRAITLLLFDENLRLIIPTSILSISMHMQNLIKFHQFVIKILNANEILTKIMAHQGS